MPDTADHRPALPPEQQRIHARCYHPVAPFVPFPRAASERSIPERFEQIARSHPGQLAIASEERAHTYAGLNAQANRVAHALLSTTRSAQQPVALLLGQGEPAIVAIMGVLKAGRSYVPLDTWLPPARLTHILADIQPEIVLTNEANSGLARTVVTGHCQIMHVEELAMSPSTENPGLTISPDALAYITYTSGSTGQPKGVMQTHRNLLELVSRYTEMTHLCAADRVAHLKSCSVTPGITCVFGSLLNGASVFPFDVKVRGVGELPGWLMRHAITLFQPGPTAFRHFAAGLTGAEAFPQLRLVSLGGEPVYGSDLDLYRQVCADQCVLIVTFGATEIPVVGRYWVDKRTVVHDATVPCGYPAEGVEFLILDDSGHEVRPGTIGEIAVKSRFVSPGYWKNPSLTQQRFSSATDGRGLYVTGDVGFTRPDGCLFHLGRRDFQVKIRGHRVEIAEVEGALAAADNVKAVAVVARVDAHGEQCLVGYVVPRGAPAPDVSALRSHLAARLPEAMIPARIVLVDALPLTPHGKVDRRALPAPDRARPALSTPFLAPRTPVETMLAHIWADVFGLEQVGINDAFLDLGGHSLLATRLLTRVVATFQVDLPVQTLLEASTIAAMAVVIVQQQAAGTGQERLAWMLEHVESRTTPGSSGSNQP
jgi:amino acid adenylation domain-containing protein